MVKNLIPDVSLTWVHENWELLGGVKMAGKKLHIRGCIVCQFTKTTDGILMKSLRCSV